VNTEPLFFRCDAGPRIGTGHVMRCLALAQAWQDQGGRCVFLTAAGPPVVERLREEGMEVRAIDAPWPAPADLVVVGRSIAEHPGAWCVLDGYHFDSAYQQAVRQAAAGLLLIDDEGHLPAYCGDLILNQNIHGHGVTYEAAGAGKLLGTRYALLRREFGAWCDWQRAVPHQARRVLVTLGGADPENGTLKALQALARLDGGDWEAVVVIGAANARSDEIEIVARQCRFPVRVERTVRDMPGLMAWADLAVAAAGGTCWELCFMGLPSVLVELAPNQIPLARALHDRGAAINLGWHAGLHPDALAGSVAALANDPDRRSAFAAEGRRLVDGRGARRVVEAIRAEGPALGVRRAGADDCRCIWEWANDATSRAASFSSEAIPWEQHTSWYGNKMRDPDCYFYVVTDAQRRPVGMVRYDRKGTEAVVSINIAPAQRGRGLGPASLRASARKLFAEADVQRIIALIKPENQASVVAFERAGYRLLDGTTAQRRETLRFGLGREEGQA
jgi:UDP-2,4-diacetamido-2,4,6-trideoxy-beta-L-altropyranose hydrolase